ncbi:MAG: CRISPR-associated endonuclease Cas2 [Myxococcales bacterium]|nr:CRISPR-associated endonuclease Cas2 [Myxococcales bacterium]
MKILVCYDVANTDRHGQKRLRKIAEACRDYGVRVQFSLFECQISERDWVCLRARLLELYDDSKDSLRFYMLSEDSARKTEHHGVRTPIDVSAPLVV